MNREELKNRIASLLDQQIQCVLATVAGDRPCQHMMAYVYSDDLSRVYLATYMDTRKSRNMLTNPHVSLLWDNRSNSGHDHVDGYSLIASGRAELVAEKLAANIQQSILDRNPNMQTLLEDDRCQLFMVLVESYQWTQGYQEVKYYAVECCA